MHEYKINLIDDDDLEYRHEQIPICDPLLDYLCIETKGNIIQKVKSIRIRVNQYEILSTSMDEILSLPQNIFDKHYGIKENKLYIIMNKINDLILNKLCGRIGIERIRRIDFEIWLARQVDDL